MTFQNFGIYKFERMNTDTISVVSLHRVIAFLCTLGISGGIFAGACAMALIPLTGQQVVTENKQHFSAWHRYLLLVSIIPIISTILLFWLPESPRFLLANGNEVEALATYQVNSSSRRFHNRCLRIMNNFR